MLTVESLREYGANVDEGLQRCFGNEALYLKLAATVPSEKNFDKLNDAINAGNLEDAFEAAHALKGALGNLSITPLYEKICEITENLRAKKEMDYSVIMADINKLRDAYAKLCE